MWCLPKVIATVNKRVMANPRLTILTTVFEMLDFYGRRASGIVGFAKLPQIVSSSSAFSLGHRMYRAAHCHILVIPQSLSWGWSNPRACTFHTGRYGSWLPVSCIGRCDLASVQCGNIYNTGQFARSQNSLQKKGRPHLITSTFLTKP